MKSFDCDKLRPCSGLIVTSETKEVQYFLKQSNKFDDSISILTTKQLKSYEEYKQLYTKSGNFM